MPKILPLVTKEQNEKILAYTLECGGKVNFTIGA